MTTADNSERPDEQVAADLLELLQEEVTETPSDLPDRTIRQVRASITTRDLIDLTTFVFIARFCGPIIDLIAGMLGAAPPGDAPGTNRRDDDE